MKYTNFENTNYSVHKFYLKTKIFFLIKNREQKIFEIKTKHNVPTMFLSTSGVRVIHNIARIWESMYKMAACGEDNLG